MAEVFTIGVVAGVSADKWTRIWRERMPEVTLRTVAVDDADAVASLSGAVHMVFARLPLPDDDDQLNSIALWEELPVAVAGKDHPIKVFDTVTLADLADEELYGGADDATLDILAAGHGVGRMPQSVFRATGRRDIVAREITDAPPTRIALVWRRSLQGELVDEFIGIVRGRTANSSRGAAEEPAPPQAAPKQQPKPAKRTPSQRFPRSAPVRGRGRRR